MRRVIRWADLEGVLRIGVELEQEGSFSPIQGTDDPLPVLRGGTFEVETDVVEATDPKTLAFPSDVMLRRRSIRPRSGARASRTVRAERQRPPTTRCRTSTTSSTGQSVRSSSSRTRSPGARSARSSPIGIRGDSVWNVPEPEIGLVLGDGGRILGYTIGNDVSSREIEGANPLYLSQAKVYAGACAIGPAVYVPETSRRAS